MESSKAHLLRLVIWQSKRTERAVFLVLAMLIAPLPDGIFGRGWMVGVMTSLATLVILVTIEVAVTGWLHLKNHQASQND